MRRALSFASVLGLILGLGGCGSDSDSLGAINKDTVKCINEYAMALRGVRNPETAKEAAAKIDKLSEQMENLKKRAEALPKTTRRLDRPHDAQPEDQEAEKKQMQELKQVIDRAAKAWAQAEKKANGEPAFTKAVQRFERLLPR